MLFVVAVVCCFIGLWWQDDITAAIRRFVQCVFRV